MEREFLKWLRTTGESDASVIVGIGDDAAVLQASNPQLVVTTDTIAEGTHFELVSATLPQIGRKSLAVSLSDIAAMGASPLWALINLQVPQAWRLDQVQDLFSGIRQLAIEFKVSIVGGDTNRWAGPLVIATTVIGEPCAKGERHVGQPWTMSGCRPGDAIVLTGPLGGSILGKHLDFEPRCQWARHLAQSYEVHAATDISDSLTVDLSLLAEASQCGVQLDLQRVPIAAAAYQLARQTGLSPLEHALYDGEDFELILAVPPSSLSELSADPVFAGKLVVVGQFTADRTCCTVDANGQLRPMKVRGYEH